MKLGLHLFLLLLLSAGWAPAAEGGGLLHSVGSAISQAASSVGHAVSNATHAVSSFFGGNEEEMAVGGNPILAKVCFYAIQGLPARRDVAQCREEESCLSAEPQHDPLLLLLLQSSQALFFVLTGNETAALGMTSLPFGQAQVTLKHTAQHQLYLVLEASSAAVR